MKVGIFFVGVVVGGLAMAYYGSTHPQETQSALRRGADHIADTVANGAAAAHNAADQQLPAGDPAPASK